MWKALKTTELWLHNESAAVWVPIEPKTYRRDFLFVPVCTSYTLLEAREFAAGKGSDMGHTNAVLVGTDPDTGEERFYCGLMWSKTAWEAGFDYQAYVVGQAKFYETYLIYDTETGLWSEVTP